jgi:hypothetical protein
MHKFLSGLFGQPSAMSTATEELQRARLQELKYQTMAEYSAAEAKCHAIMADFERGRIARLQMYTIQYNGE